MTASGAHEGRLLHMLQGPHHSSLLHHHKGCPIYREQSSIAMEPWAELAGQEYTQHTHTKTHHHAKQIQPRISTTKYYEGRDV